MALTLGVTACGIIGGPAQPTPTPDVFAGLEQRKEELKAQGRQLLAEGRYREALATLEQARVFARQPDPELDQLINQARAALQPTPTATATPPLVPPSPTPPPVPTLNPTPPDTALGQDVFGNTFLVAVPSDRTAPVPPAQDTFTRSDQIGLYIQSLTEGLRIPYTLRVFSRDTGILVGEAHAGPPPTPVPGVQPPTQPIVFFDRYIWYHTGGELPGGYRVELYADSTLAMVFEYRVSEAGPTPTPVPAITPAAAATPPLAVTPVETLKPLPTPIAAAPPPILPTPLPAPEQAPGRPALPQAPTPTPLPTATPTPSSAFQVLTGGIACCLAYNAGIDRLYVADSSGLVWAVADSQPVLQPPFKLTIERPGPEGANGLDTRGALDRPNGIAVDPTTGLVYVALRGSQAIGVFHGTTGQHLRTLNLPSRPSKVVTNPALGLVYAIMPEMNEIAILDPNQPTPIVAVASAPQATDLQLSEDGRTIYVTHLTGELSTMDARTGELLARGEISVPGLYGMTLLNGMIYAINVVQRQVISYDLSSNEVVRRTTLDQQPMAIIGGPLTGTIYVLASDNPVNAQNAPAPPVLLNIDPASGTTNGIVRLTDVASSAGNQSQSPIGLPYDDTNLMSLNTTLAVNPFSEIVYLVNPSAGRISVAAPCLYPNLSRTPAGTRVPRTAWVCPGG